MDLKTLARKPAVRRFVLWPAAAVALYAILGFLVAPPIAKAILVKRLTRSLHRPVAIRSLRINPFVLSARLRGVTVKDRAGSGPFFSFDELYLNLQLASIIRRGPVLREILLRSPSMTIVRNDDLTYNFSDLLTGTSSATSGEARPLRYSLNNIRIVGGRINFDDRPKHTRHTVRDLSLAIPFLSNLPYATKIFVQPSFHAIVNGAEVALRGMTKPYSPSRETTVNLGVSAFDIPHYLAYIPMRTNFRVPSGRLDAAVVLTFAQPVGEPPALSLHGTVTLTNLSVTDAAEAPLLRLPSLSVGIGSLEPLQRRALLDNVILSSPEVSLARGKTGGWNALSLFPHEAKGAKAEAKQERKTGGNADARGSSFAFEIRSLQLTGGKIAVSDQSAPRPFRATAGIDLSARIRAASGKEGTETVLKDVDAKVTALRLRRGAEKEDRVAIPEMEVRGVDVDLAKKTATIGYAGTRKGVVRVTREKDGAIDLAKLLSSVEGTTGPAPPPPPAERPGKANDRTWIVLVKKAALEGYSVVAVDRSPEDPVTMRISRLGITAENLSTEKGRRGKVSVSAVVNKTGKVAVKGSLGLRPLAAKLGLRVRMIDLVPFQPFVADRLNITLTGGKASARGTLTVAGQDNGAVRTTYTGQILVSKLATIDNATSEDLLNWDSLELDGVHVATSPLSVAIRDVALSDFYARVIITPEGSLNLKGIARKTGTDNAAAAKPTESPEPPTPVSIQSVTLQGGRINFTDHYIKPNYSANLTGIGGRVSGLSSQETQMADVDLRGKLGNSAPLEITGKINPLRKDLYVDLKVDFQDMDLSPLTPYSDRYAGYTIEKGKLSLRLKYLITNRKLTASNNVFLDQFTFGHAVDSPDATKLPVRLAIALLKDRNGEIHLDLPISGSLDDPQFRLGPVIVKIVVNLLVKAATSPFALLGAVFGGGEELSYLEFPYGKDAPDAKAAAKLKTLEKALHDRPALKLEITGHVDPEKDREALRRLRFDREVRAQKLKDLVRKGGQVPSLDNVVVGPKEYPEYLRRAYRATKFPKPRNFIGMVKDLPVPEMEKLMYAHIRVTDGDLRLLAQRRAQAVKNLLIASNQVKPERIFLVEPKTLAPEKKEGLPESRVVFALK